MKSLAESRGSTREWSIFMRSNFERASQLAGTFRNGFWVTIPCSSYCASTALPTFLTLAISAKNTLRSGIARLGSKRTLWLYNSIPCDVTAFGCCHVSRYQLGAWTVQRYKQQTSSLAMSSECQYASLKPILKAVPRL